MIYYSHNEKLNKILKESTIQASYSNTRSQEQKLQTASISILKLSNEKIAAHSKQLHSGDKFQTHTSGECSSVLSTSTYPENVDRAFNEPNSSKAANRSTISFIHRLLFSMLGVVFSVRIFNTLTSALSLSHTFMP